MTDTLSTGIIIPSGTHPSVGSELFANVATAWTATSTLTAAQFPGAHDNTGAAGAVTLTLPAVADVKNTSARFTRIATQSLVVTGPAANTVSYGGSTYQTVTLGADNDGLSLFCDGQRYYVTDWHSASPIA